RFVSAILGSVRPGLAYVFWQCATADAWSIRLHFFFASSPQKNTNVHFALLSISCLLPLASGS
ncbi:hypothetical protein, partial [Pseudomonas syringae]|uniref:hypothetical protein n=1 Tax=Pseudomonas syringae TaxID=317 RepID=UPI001E331108